MGHAPRNVTARHYLPRLASASFGEADALERQASLFRLHITGLLDEELGSQTARTGILNFFERRPSQLADAFKMAGT